MLLIFWAHKRKRFVTSTCYLSLNQCRLLSRAHYLNQCEPRKVRVTCLALCVCLVRLPPHLACRRVQASQRLRAPLVTRMSIRQMRKERH